jgi:DNA-directed RNA polymerase I, II, and III subunit RPABC1
MSDCQNFYLYSGLKGDINLLYTIYTNLYDMLKDRNYDISKMKMYNTIDEFKKQFKNVEEPDVSVLKFILSKNDNKDDKISIFWNDDEKIGIRVLKSNMEDMNKKGVKRGILIVKYSMSTFAKKSIDEFNQNQSNMYFETFDYSELMMNITKHVLVPKHIVLTEDEVTALKDKYSLKRITQLPKLHKTDPMTKYFGLMPGNVVKVVRNNPIGSKYITYRIVI